MSVKCCIYLAGPMTGYPEHNVPAFAAATEKLEAAGFEVVSPHKLHAEALADGTAQRESSMRIDIKELVGCDAVAFLPGWEKSQGANTEAMVAWQCGIRTFEYCDGPLVEHLLLLDTSLRQLPYETTVPAGLSPAGEVARIEATERSDD